MENSNELVLTTISIGLIGAVLSFIGVGLILFFSRQIFNARNIFSKKYIENNRVTTKKTYSQQTNSEIEQDSLSEIKARLEKLLKIEV